MAHTVGYTILPLLQYGIIIVHQLAILILNEKQKRNPFMLWFHIGCMWYLDIYLRDSMGLSRLFHIPQKLVEVGRKSSHISQAEAAAQDIAGGIKLSGFPSAFIDLSKFSQGIQSSLNEFVQTSPSSTQNFLVTDEENNRTWQLESSRRFEPEVQYW